MNKLNQAVIIAIMGLTLVGCEVGGSDSKVSNTEQQDYRQGVEVRYADGSVMGVTREGVAINGGYNIYDIGTGEIIGWVDVAGNVNDVGGKALGVCNGLLNEAENFNNSCTLTVENPSKPKPRKPSKSGGSRSNPSAPVQTSSESNDAVTSESLNTDQQGAPEGHLTDE